MNKIPIEIDTGVITNKLTAILIPGSDTEIYCNIIILNCDNTNTTISLHININLVPCAPSSRECIMR